MMTAPCLCVVIKMALAAAAVGTVDFWCCPRVCAAGQVVVWACRLSLPGHWPLSRSASKIASSFRLPILPHHTTHISTSPRHPHHNQTPHSLGSPTFLPTTCSALLPPSRLKTATRRNLRHPWRPFFSTLQTPPRLVSPCSAFPAHSRFNIASRPPPPSPHRAIPPSVLRPEFDQKQKA
jgi:hypothetical protein